MANLRDRLKRIQEIKKTEPLKEVQSSFDISGLTGVSGKALCKKGWETCGYYVLKKEVIVKLPVNFSIKLPQALMILIPDLLYIKLPNYDNFVFFDLETTGLSGGAGTVAFLAAFGKLLKNNRLQITQYLLLDYPGENDFLEAVLKEFENEHSVMVSYNGKCFDSQILKTRCLMNGFRQPEYSHVDLLHPARRLWKNIVCDCSQASIETRIIGIDRSDDIPGSMAPEIWFDFLKTGRTDRLTGICQHNQADIAGLVSILAVMILIAENPLEQRKYRYDVVRLAMYWRDFLCKEKKYLLPQYNELLNTGIKLLNYVADSDFPDNIKAEAERFLAIYKNRWLRNIR